MPVYEYEHDYDECELCDFRFGVVQSVGEYPIKFCPYCGLEVHRVVSQIAIVKSRNFSASKAAEKGFTTWHKTGHGEWEKLDGPGVDAIVATEEDKKSLADESKPTLDLDLEP